MAAPHAELVGHVEAFVDVTNSSRDHDASCAAIASLVKRDLLTIHELVKEMEMYLTTIDHVIRARGVLLLADVLAEMSDKPLDNDCVSSLASFFIAKLSDWHALRGTLVGCLALMQRKQNLGTINMDNATNLWHSFLNNVSVQSLGAADRKLCFQLLILLFITFPEAATAKTPDGVIYRLCESIDNEKDPECLKLSFNLVETMLQLFSKSSQLTEDDAADVFDLISGYFPVYLTNHGVSSDVTRDELSLALMNAFCSTPYFEPFAIPFLLEKLSSSLHIAKVDSLRYLNRCITFYGPDRMAKHARNIWYSLKDVMFHLPQTTFSSRKSSETIEKTEHLLGAEVFNCFRTVITCMTASDKDVVTLILTDEDISMKVSSLVHDETFSPCSAECWGQLTVVGDVISILTECSTYSCSEVFQVIFLQLMDLLGVPGSYSLDSIHSVATDKLKVCRFGATYLCFRIISSCKKLTSTSKDYFTLAESSWWGILTKFAESLINLVLSALDADSEIVTGEIAQQFLLHNLKVLQELLTFPTSCTPISDVASSHVLSVLVSMIRNCSEITFLWSMTLDALSKIGLSWTTNCNSQGKTLFGKIVVESIVSLLHDHSSLVPLPSRLDAVFQIGIAGPDYMLKIAQQFEEAIVSSFLCDRIEGRSYFARLLECYSNRILPWLCTCGYSNGIAMQFSLRIWNEVRNMTTLRNIAQQGSLEALMMAMKLLVGICSEEHQTVIVQKAYDILLSSNSFSTALASCSLSNYNEMCLSNQADDLSLLSLFTSVVISLRAETSLPDIEALLKLFSAYLLNGFEPAAQALASVINKLPEKNDVTDLVCKWTPYNMLEAVLEICFSTVLKGKYSSYYPHEQVDNPSCLYNVQPRASEIELVVGLAWIGKCFLMRGDVRLNSITMFLLKLLLPSESYDGSGASSVQDLTNSAADAFGIIVKDSEICLNRKFHAVMKPLYKQHFFSTLLPIVQSLIKESSMIQTKAALYHAFGYVISEAPLVAVVTEAHRIISLLVDVLKILSEERHGRDVLHRCLLVLAGILMDSIGKDHVVENLHIVIKQLIQLASYPHMMVVRETALQCLLALSAFPHAKIYPFRNQVLQAMTSAVGDKKRTVRVEAVKCRHAWTSIV